MRESNTQKRRLITKQTRLINVACVDVKQSSHGKKTTLVSLHVHAERHPPENRPLCKRVNKRGN